MVNETAYRKSSFPSTSSCSNLNFLHVPRCRYPHSFTNSRRMTRYAFLICHRLILHNPRHVTSISPLLLPKIFFILPFHSLPSHLSDCHRHDVSNTHLPPSSNLPLTPVKPRQPPDTQPDEHATQQPLWRPILSIPLCRAEASHSLRWAHEICSQRIVLARC